MKQTYRIVGWMTELEKGLTVLEWQSVLERLDPELDYVPFEVAENNSVIYGMIDYELAEVCDYKVNKFLRPALAPVCENWENESDLCEYPISEDLVAYVGSSFETATEDCQLSHVDSFEQFVVEQGLTMEAKLIYRNSNGTGYRVELFNEREQRLEIPDYFLGYSLGDLKTEYVLEDIASDLANYHHHSYDDWSDSMQQEFFQSIRNYYIFTNQEERETLLRLLEE